MGIFSWAKRGLAIAAMGVVGTAGADPTPTPTPTPTETPTPTPTPTPGMSFGPATVLNSNADTDSGNDFRPQALPLPADGDMWAATWTTTDDLSTVDISPAYDLGTDEDIVFAFSTTDGDSWSDPAPIPNAENDLGDDALSRIATAGGTIFADGTLAMVWQSNDDPTSDILSTDYDILFTKYDLSEPGVWSSPVRLHASMASDQIDDYEPQIIAVTADHWIVSWHGADQTANTLGTDMEIFISESTDAGDTWSAPTTLNNTATTDAGDDLYPQIAIKGDFQIAVWQSNDSLTSPALVEDNDIHVSLRNPSTSAAWTTPTKLNSAMVSDSADDGAPQVVLLQVLSYVLEDDYDMWFVIWQSNNDEGSAGEDYDIYYDYAAANSESWDGGEYAEPLNANWETDAGDDLYPHMATDGPTWAAVWESTETLDDTVGEDRDILGVHLSVENASTPDWSPKVINSTAWTDAGDDVRPKIATDGQGRWLVVWTSNETLGNTIGSDEDIFYSTSDDVGPTPTISPTPTPTPTISPTPTDTPTPTPTPSPTPYDVLTCVSEQFVFSVYEAIPPSQVTPTPTHQGTLSGDDQWPRMATDGVGRWVMVWHSNEFTGPTPTPTAKFDAQDSGDENDYEILLKYSTNDAATWSETILVNAPYADDDDAAQSAPPMDIQPHVATDKQGKWFIAWTSKYKYNPSNPSEVVGVDEDIFGVAFDFDGSTSVTQATFNSASIIPVNNNATSENTAGDFGPRVVVDGAGHWVVIWVRGDEQDPNTMETLGLDTDILYARSTTDNLAQWTTPEALNLDAYGDTLDDGMFGITSTVNADDVFLAFWSRHDPTAGTYRVVYAYSTDFGANWSEPAYFSPTQTANDMEGIPEVATDSNGNWMAVWKSNRIPGDDSQVSDDYDFLYSVGSDDLVYWTPIDYLTPDAETDTLDEAFLHLAANAVGNWTVVYSSWEIIGGTPSIYSSVYRTSSNDMGQSWTWPEKVSTGDGANQRSFRPWIATDENNDWVIAWHRSTISGEVPSQNEDIIVAHASDDCGNEEQHRFTIRAISEEQFLALDANPLGAATLTNLTADVSFTEMIPPLVDPDEPPSLDGDEWPDWENAVQNWTREGTTPIHFLPEEPNLYQLVAGEVVGGGEFVGWFEAQSLVPLGEFPETVVVCDDGTEASPVAVDPDGEVYAVYRVDATPHKLFVDSFPLPEIPIGVEIDSANSVQRTTIDLQFAEPETVTLTAPEEAEDGLTFSHWVELVPGADPDGLPTLSETNDIEVSVDGTVSRAAIYVTPTPTPTPTPYEVTLTVQTKAGTSTINPGAEISIQPLDKNNDGDGTTTFTRVFNNGTPIFLTASRDYTDTVPLRFNHWEFSSPAPVEVDDMNVHNRWSIFTLDANATVTAVYEELTTTRTIEVAARIETFVEDPSNILDGLKPPKISVASLPSGEPGEIEFELNAGTYTPIDLGYREDKDVDLYAPERIDLEDIAGEVVFDHWEVDGVPANPADVDGIRLRTATEVDGTSVTAVFSLDPGPPVFCRDMPETPRFININAPDKTILTPTPTPAPDCMDDFQHNVATDGKGNWMAVWVSRNKLLVNETNDGVQERDTIHIAISHTDGRSWSVQTEHPKARAGSTETLKSWQRKPVVDVNEDGTWIVAWLSYEYSDSDVPWESTTEPAPWLHWDIYVTRFAPANDTEFIDDYADATAWSDPVKIGAQLAVPSREVSEGFPSRDQYPPDLPDTELPNGWLYNDIGGLDFGLTLRPGSEDGLTNGSSWVIGYTSREDVTMTTSSATGGGFYFEADTNGTLTTGTDSDLYHVISTDDGVSWSPRRLINRNGAWDNKNDGLDTPNIGVFGGKGLGNFDMETDGKGNWVAIWISNRTLLGVTHSAQAGYALKPRDVFYAISTNDAQSWSSVKFLRSDYGTWNPGRAPELATDGKGRWVATWLGSPNGAPETLDLRGALIENISVTTVDFDQLVAARYSQTTIPWSTPTYIPVDDPRVWRLLTGGADGLGNKRSATTPMSPQIVSDRFGNLTMSWGILPTPLLAIFAGVFSTEIAYSTSDDGGLTWSLPRLVCRPHLSLGGRTSPQPTTNNKGDWMLSWAGFLSDPEGLNKNYVRKLVPNMNAANQCGTFDSDLGFQISEPFLPAPVFTPYPTPPPTPVATPAPDEFEATLSSPTQDTSIVNNNSTDFGLGNYVRAGVSSNGSGGNRVRGIVQFDLASKVTEAHADGKDFVKKATLRLYLIDINYGATPDTGIANRKISVHRLKHAWLENWSAPDTFASWNAPGPENQTWDMLGNTAPATFISAPTDSVNHNYGPSETVGAWIDYDVTDDVRYLSRRLSENNGWLVKMDGDNSTVSGVARYASKEYSGGAYAPQLVLTFTSILEDTNFTKKDENNQYLHGWEKVDVSNGVTPSDGVGGLCLALGTTGTTAGDRWQTKTTTGGSPNAYKGYIDLVPDTVYRVGVTMSTDVGPSGTVPHWTIAYNNAFPAITGDNADDFYYTNTFGGGTHFSDKDGGANGIMKSNGRSEYEFWITPNSVATDQWNGRTPDDSTRDYERNAFNPLVDAVNDINLSFGLIDQSNGASRKVCLKKLRVDAVRIGDLVVQEVLWDKPITSLHYQPTDEADKMRPPMWLDDPFVAEINNNFMTADYRMPGITCAVTPTPVPMPILPDIVSQRLMPFDSETAGLSTAERLYPFTWENDTLYRVTAYVRSNVRDGNGVLGDTFGEEGTDPVDIIALKMESANLEIAEEHYSTRGGEMPEPGNPSNSIPSPMTGAASPLLPANTEDGEAQPYTAYFYSHNTTGSSVPDRDRLRFFAEFRNKIDYLGADSGTDPFSVVGFKVEKLVMPMTIKTPVPTPVPTPAFDDDKLTFYGEQVNTADRLEWTQVRGGRYLYDPATPVNDVTCYIEYPDPLPDDKVEIVGYFPRTQGLSSPGVLLTVRNTSTSWTYGTTVMWNNLSSTAAEELMAGNVSLRAMRKVPNSFPVEYTSYFRAQLHIDTDDDGLSDFAEGASHTDVLVATEDSAVGTEPFDRDTDDDGLLDGEEFYGWERLNKYGVTSDPLAWDTDGDGLSDGLELGVVNPINTESKNFPSSKPSEWNSPETIGGSDELETLDDALFHTDGWRFEDAHPASTTDPTQVDTDKDGFWDGGDRWKTTPNGTTFYRRGEDFNENGLIEPNGDDSREYTIDDESDPSHPNDKIRGEYFVIDADSDRLPEWQELELGTNPKDRDSDDDGIIDGDEYFGVGPNFADGWRFETLPQSPDSDQDGVPDGTELGVFGENPTGTTPQGILGTDTEADYSFVNWNGDAIHVSCYTPDDDQGDSATLMDPVRWDTNGDSIKDGWQDKNCNGAYEPDGEDENDTADDEGDAVYGIRAPYGYSSTYIHSARHLWLLEYDEESSDFANAPPKEQNLDFYWGSATIESANIEVDDEEMIALSTNILYNDGDNKSSFVVSATNDLEQEYAISVIGDGYEAATANAEGLEYVRIPITSLTYIGLTHVTGRNTLSIEKIPASEKRKDIINLDYLFQFHGEHSSFSGETKDYIEQHADLRQLGESVNDFLKTKAGVEFYIKTDHPVDDNLRNFSIFDRSNTESMIFSLSDIVLPHAATEDISVDYGDGNIIHYAGNHVRNIRDTLVPPDANFDQPIVEIELIESLEADAADRHLQYAIGTNDIGIAIENHNPEMNRGFNFALDIVLVPFLTAGGSADSWFSETQRHIENTNVYFPMHFYDNKKAFESSWKPDDNTYSQIEIPKYRTQAVKQLICHELIHYLTMSDSGGYHILEQVVGSNYPDINIEDRTNDDDLKMFLLELNDGLSRSEAELERRRDQYSSNMISQGLRRGEFLERSHFAFQTDDEARRLMSTNTGTYTKWYTNSDPRNVTMEKHAARDIYLYPVAEDLTGDELDYIKEKREILINGLRYYNFVD